jgi:hypothetical protein
MATTKNSMTNAEFETFLMDTILAGDAAEDLQIANVQTFQEAGVLTRNKGLVVRMADGTEFQVQINGSY